MLNPHLKYELSKIASRIGHSFQYGLGFGLSFALLKLFEIV